jgi:hypothetical protein
LKDLREDLEQRAARFTADHDSFDRVMDRVARRRLARRISTGIVSFVIAFAALAGLWSATRPASVPVGTPTPTSVTPTPARPQQPLPHDGLEITSSQRVGGWIVLADASGVRVAGAGTLTLVNPETGSMAPAGQGQWDYDYAVLAEYGQGTVFLASGTTLSELALDGTVLRRFDLGELGYLDAVHFSSFDGGSLWVAGSGPPTGGNAVARVDVDSGRILERYPVGQGLHQITDAGGYLFVASRNSSHAIVRIDLRTGAVGNGPDVWSGWLSIVGIRDRLWVEEGDVVHCIEATDFAPCGDMGEIRIPRAEQLAADGPFLWVLSGTGSKRGSVYVPDPKQPATVTLVDGMTGAVLGGPVALPDTTPATISGYGGHAWVGFHDTGGLVEIDRCPPGSCTTRSS